MPPSRQRNSPPSALSSGSRRRARLARAAPAGPLQAATLPLSRRSRWPFFLPGRLPLRSPSPSAGIQLQLLLATAPAPALAGCTLLHREERKSERLQACWCACGCALLLLCSDLLHQPSRIRSSGDEHGSYLLGQPVIQNTDSLCTEI
ncbi:hypothetical protein PVAP13_1KG065677 [Panicum virgatum]|uniref:Uncharacterized protein n=1 Tax=Panicum virgatum TaxID=38727 RepID=A0A8T0XBS0_PANVG|nr:hypothetical protein PVAP13_1KG065677 [Panicum virgatum]